MKLNELSPAPGSKKNKTRLGRGIGCGLGKTCGKGHKGQKARAGGYNRRGFEGGQMPLQIRVPKFGFKSIVGMFTQQIRLSTLNVLSENVVTIDLLKQQGLIKQSTKFVKVIAHGEFTKVIKTSGLRVSSGAKAIIEKNGGSVE